MSLADVQAMKALKMAREIYDSSKNLFDSTKATIDKIVDNVTGNLTTQVAYYATDYIPIEPKVKYVASGGQNKNYAWYDANKVFISGGNDLTILISPVNAKYIRLTIHPDDYPTYQFEKGTNQTTYIPYGKNTNTIFSRSRNLFDQTKANDNSIVNYQTGGLTVTTGYYATDYIPVTPKLKYVVSGGLSRPYAWYDVNKNFLTGNSAISSLPLVVPNNAYYIRLTINPADYSIYQFEQGTTPTPYIPFGGQVNRLDFIQNSINNRFFGKIGNFLGDSITWGYSPADGSKLANPYPTLVGKALGLSKVINIGISGSTVGDVGGGANSPMCNRYTDTDATGELNFIFGGTNDWSKNVPLGTITDNTSATYYGALNILITGMLNRFPTQTIVLATPLHRSGDTVANASGSTLNDYRNASIAIGTKYGIAVLDLYATSGFYPDNTTNKNAVMPDGTHPNDVGHIKLANRVTGFLKTV